MKHITNTKVYERMGESIVEWWLSEAKGTKNGYDIAKLVEEETHNQPKEIMAGFLYELGRAVESGKVKLVWQRKETTKTYNTIQFAADSSEYFSKVYEQFHTDLCAKDDPDDIEEYEDRNSEWPE